MVDSSDSSIAKIIGTYTTVINDQGDPISGQVFWGNVQEVTPTEAAEITQSGYPVTGNSYIFSSPGNQAGTTANNDTPVMTGTVNITMFSTDDPDWVQVVAVPTTGETQSIKLQKTPYSIPGNGGGQIYYAPSQTVSADGTGIGSGYYEYTNQVYTPSQDIPTVQQVSTSSAGASFTPATTVPPCFVTGTSIRTPEGDVAVEHIKVGDMVMTASGQIRRVRWIGNWEITGLSADDKNWDLRPVRIAAHAFAPNRPDRDLFVSPGHSIAVTVMDEVFTQAIRLINGATIHQVPYESVTYWHVELDSHDVLLSNNLPSESYLDVGNRDGLGLVLPALHPVGSIEDYARPLIEEGPVIAGIRARLVDRAKALGWQVSGNCDMHLNVDGQRVEAVMDGDLACFIFPAAAQDVHLLSRTFIPAEGGDSNDQRILGLCLNRVHISDGLKCSIDVSLKHQCFEKQFYAEENKDNVAWRWTSGNLCLSPELWAECKSHVILTLSLHSRDESYWEHVEAEKKDVFARNDENVIRLKQLA